MVSQSDLFAAIDRMDPDGWAAQLAPDVVMRFANETPVYGRDACRQRAVAMFDSMASIAHAAVDHWEHGDATIVEASVTFTLPDGTEHVLPMVTIYRVAAGLIADYRVYVDPGPLWP